MQPDRYLYIRYKRLWALIAYIKNMANYNNILTFTYAHNTSNLIAVPRHTFW